MTPETMRAAVYYNNSDVRLEERPVPKIGAGEALVRIKASGICGSDVLEWYRVPKAPIVLGHEVAGDVVEVGEGVGNVAVGDRVVLSHHVPCNTCRYCLSGNHTACHTLHTTNFDPGGFAEYVRMPALQTDRGILKMPDSMSYEEGSFVEPLGCVVRAQVRAGVRPGSTVLVMGSGISGLLHIRLALALGAGKVFATDVSQYRLDWALKSGAAGVFNAIEAGDKLPELLRDANDGQLADLVILGTGAPSAIDQGLACLENGATFVVFAVPAPGQDHPMPLNELWRREVSVRTAYGAAPADLAMAMDLIATGRVAVTDLITHRLPLERAQEGFGLVANAGESVKVVIEP
ncbi:MAG TPA: alcohol dehydrogenase catalytic domain-containing protein [Coriobacteriia bacterium]|nr:alcohol dehydrogenase catalytic domain-containing protein [Coriobacteriia bacterium]